MATTDYVRKFVQNRHFESHTKRALIHLARDPGASYREVGRAHRIDPGRLYKTASLVPGLVELRKHRRNGIAA